ncbi:MAG TPA: flagellar biosynthesis protein FlhB [Candidatus Avoscillospira avistercoris]|uniref:Flagellar biosynthetic protein FlhB n=1 Tax=Candidatus Avoscillospira avistercoris TaxID=2840707 RepID=A0A9D1FBD9_9FIRM|nr:flagellar biosynthesis protein FlhB [Candidatus Avoscillospira avistercoris]
MADSSKTEKATPKKRRDERKKGHIFFSNDAVSVVVLLACFWTIKLLGPGAAEELASFFYFCMHMATDSTGLPGTELVIRLLVSFAKTAGPLLAVSVAAGLGATFFQTRLLVSGESIRPKLSRLNPIQGFTRLFSLRSIIEALKGLLKILLLLVLIYQFISGVVGLFTKYLDTDLPTACAHLFEETFRMVNQILLVYVVLAGADVFYQWWDYERQMRMSKQEIKEEYKQMEGDPQIKGKIKEAQRRRAQSRMMQQVPQADVVIRNPTHFAVALRYNAERDDAPVVLAKGQDELALRIVRIAEEHQIAVVENVPLARALYASTELNMPIPPELYNAVAEVLVYLYRMDGKLKKGEKVGS